MAVSGTLRMCEADQCWRTFWAHGPQRFCRNRECQGARFLASFSEPIQEAVADALDSTERRKWELQQLIGEQAYDMRRGHVVTRDSQRTGAVMSYDQVTDAVAAAFDASRGYVPDWWTTVVHAKVDFWREIGAIAVPS